MQVKVDPTTDVAPGTYRNVNGTEATALGLRRRVDQVAGCRWCSARYPITPASELLHALVAPPGPGRAHDPGRGRDRGRVDGAGRGVRRRARRDVHVRPGPGPEDRDDRPGGDARAADGDHRRPARRPVDRHADQDRAVGPAAGAVRPPRRVAAAGARGRRRPGQCFEAVYEAVRIAVTLPHAGDPAERPVRRQLERAVADPVGRRRCRRSTRASARRRARTPFLPYARDDNAARGRGRSRARPGSRTGSAGSRSRTAPATSPTTAPTTRA